MVSIAVVGLYIAYGLPILFRVTLARHTFAQGPVKFGGQFCSLFIGWIAVLWVITITVLFCLPVRYPVDVQSLNYTPVAVGGVFVLTISYWVLSARKWFKGPQVNLKVWHELFWCVYISICKISSNNWEYTDTPSFLCNSHCTLFKIVVWFGVKLGSLQLPVSGQFCPVNLKFSFMLRIFTYFHHSHLSHVANNVAHKMNSTHL